MSQVTPCYFSLCGKIRAGAAMALAIAAAVTERSRSGPGRAEGGPSGQAVRPERPLPSRRPGNAGGAAGWREAGTQACVGWREARVCGSRKRAGLWARPVWGWFSSGATHRR